MEIAGLNCLQSQEGAESGAIGGTGSGERKKQGLGDAAGVSGGGGGVGGGAVGKRRRPRYADGAAARAEERVPRRRLE